MNPSLLRRSRLLAMGGLLAIASAGFATGPDPTLSAPEALAAAQAGELTLVDIRTPQEWRQTGVAKGVVRIDMRDPGFDQALLAAVGGNKDAPIALICRTGNRTGRLLPRLQQQGFTHLYHIPEGMMGSAAGPGWIARGLPLERCESC